MNWIDAVVLIVWGITAMWGFSAGLIRIIFPLIAVIVGLAVSSRIAEDVGNVFSVVTDNEAAQAIGGFVLIFLGLFIISAIVGMFLKIIPLFGLANRLAGMAVGVVIGFLLLSGVLTGVQRYSDRMDDDIDESALGVFLADNFDEVIRGVKLIPGDWDHELNELRKRVE